MVAVGIYRPGTLLPLICATVLRFFLAMGNPGTKPDCTTKKTQELPRVDPFEMREDRNRRRPATWPWGTPLALYEDHCRSPQDTGSPHLQSWIGKPGVLACGVVGGPTYRGKTPTHALRRAILTSIDIWRTAAIGEVQGSRLGIFRMARSI